MKFNRIHSHRYVGEYSLIGSYIHSRCFCPFSLFNCFGSTNLRWSLLFGPHLNPYCKIFNR